MLDASINYLSLEGEECALFAGTYSNILLYNNMPAGSYLSSFLHNTLKTNQVEINTDSRTLRPVAKLKEPRDLFASPKELGCPQGAARWPAECQVCGPK